VNQGEELTKWHIIIDKQQNTRLIKPRLFSIFLLTTAIQRLLLLAKSWLFPQVHHPWLFFDYSYSCLRFKRVI